MNRFGFLGAAAAFGSATGLSPALAQSPPIAVPESSITRRPTSQFFRDASMNFIFLIVLGGTYSGVGDAGTLLAMIDTVTDGDDASAFAALNAYGDRARAAGDASLNGGHRASARSYYLQASNYIFASTYFCDGMGAPEKMRPAFERHREIVDQAFALFEHPVEHVSIPYEGTHLAGYFIKPDTSAQPRPLFIMTNGADASVLDMWVQGGAAAIERGYNVLIYDGPGQNTALFRQNLYFRPDWEHVVTPVVDFVLRRPDVDPKRIALQGVSQGGYWAPRAMAFEKRIAAGVADTGVYDVSLAWMATVTPELRTLLDAGDKAAFDRGYTAMMARSKGLSAFYAFHARPYGFSSPFDTIQATRKYTLAGLTDRITAPVLVTAPDDDQFFAGQPRKVYDLLPNKKKAIVDFTRAEGANGHCEPATPGLRSLRVFDWLDTTLA